MKIDTGDNKFTVLSLCFCDKAEWRVIRRFLTFSKEDQAALEIKIGNPGFVF